MKFRPISISLSPDSEKDDIFLAFKLLFLPWLWKKGKKISEFESEFKTYLGVKNAYSFNSGRSALYAILKALKSRGFGEKVILQAFTCNASINPVLWLKMRPIYVDCGLDDFNLDIADLEAKIRQNPDAKILMVQHTFGLPADMKKILEICEKNNIFLIEDCAHSLGAKYEGRLVGTFGKAAFFSFSRDKIISSVYGGMAGTNDEALAKDLEKIQSELPYPGNFWVFQQLLHPVLLNWIILPVYRFLNVGKIFLLFSQIFHILSKAVSWQEKRGERPDYFPARFPNALAVLAQNQRKKIERFNRHRKEISDYYYQALQNTEFILPKNFAERENVFLRFTVKSKNVQKIIYRAWHKENILIGDWYNSPIAPNDTRLEAMEYKIGMCKNAEYLAKTTFNLPTHINISRKDAERIVEFLKNYK